MAKTSLVSAVGGFALSSLVPYIFSSVKARLHFTVVSTFNRISKLTSLMKLDKAHDNLLSDVVIKEMQADPRTRPIISKYLYGETLLSDSSSEVRWRYRYFSGYYVNFLRADVEESQEPEEISRSRHLEEVADPFKHVFGI